MTHLQSARARLQGSLRARNQRGATTVEYAILIAVLLLCVFGGYRLLFRNVSESVINTGEHIQNLSDGQHMGSRKAAGGVAAPAQQ
jgi:Flp pilus assembly pilin Flp